MVCELYLSLGQSDSEGFRVIGIVLGAEFQLGLLVGFVLGFGTDVSQVFGAGVAGINDLPEEVFLGEGPSKSSL
jgi:hypothetical protein